jgi:hypothetical protein
MPMKPAPRTSSAPAAAASPITLLIAIIPASAPEISMATMVIRTGSMPA